MSLLLFFPVPAMLLTPALPYYDVKMSAVKNGFQFNPLTPGASYVINTVFVLYH